VLLKPKRIISFYLQKAFKFNKAIPGFRFFITLSLLVCVLPEFLSGQVIRKSQVSFLASDSLLVSADLYQSRKSNPFIVLFHEEQSCKGEFDSIVSRFIKMNYNCLAVDLRSGDNLGFLKNETAIRAKEGGYSTSLTSAALDMTAAINYIFLLSSKKVNIYGSGSSASLALIVGRDNENVKAIVAFSPGEYFEPEYNLKTILTNYPKPLFVGCTALEYTYFSDIEGFPGTDKVLFKPASGEGMRGTRALLRENLSRDEYWLSLLIFFKSLQ